MWYRKNRLAYIKYKCGNIKYKYGPVYINAVFRYNETRISFLFIHKELRPMSFLEEISLRIINGELKCYDDESFEVDDLKIKYANRYVRVGDKYIDDYTLYKVKSIIRGADIISNKIKFIGEVVPIVISNFTKTVILSPDMKSI